MTPLVTEMLATDDRPLWVSVTLTSISEWGRAGGRRTAATAHVGAVLDARFPPSALPAGMDATTAPAPVMPDTATLYVDGPPLTTAASVRGAVEPSPAPPKAHAVPVAASVPVLHS